MNELFLKRMQEILKDEYDDFLKAMQKPPVKGFYTNPLKENVIAHLQTNHITKHPYIENGYYFDHLHYRLGKHPYFHCGLYYIQEPSAMAVANLLDIKDDAYVLDMCAAPGGKTCQVASKISKNGLVIANDISHMRASILSENVERFGLQNTIVTSCDPTVLPQTFSNFFDTIILDAPCSGEGMFRKLEKAVDTWSLQKVQECSHIQKQLVESAYKMLKKDGILVYSTCTYSLEENEEIVSYCKDVLHMTCLPISKQEEMMPGIGNENVVRMYPHHTLGEGQFMALLQKVEEDKPIKITPLQDNCPIDKRKLVQTFYKDYLNIEVPPYLYDSNNHIYAILPQFPVIKKARILKNGLYLGECKKGRFEPSLSLALTLHKEDVKQYYDFPYNAKEVEQYLHGETLTGTTQKGYGVIFVDGYPLSFYKESNQQVKNLYPKGLRR